MSSSSNQYYYRATAVPPHVYEQVDSSTPKSQRTVPDQFLASPSASTATSDLTNTMRFDFVERRLSNLFGIYITVVTRFPKTFMLVPVCVTLVLLFGFVKNPPLIRDELSLYTPVDAPARRELALLDRYFDIDDTDPFYALRRHDLNRMGHVIVTGHPPGVDILTPATLDAIYALWQTIASLEVYSPDTGLSYNYSSLCVHAKRKRSAQQLPGNFTTPHQHQRQLSDCVLNPLLQAYGDVRHDLNETALLLAKLRYPVTTNGWFIGHTIGGITVNDDKYVSGARAMMLPYMLKHSSVELDHVAATWEYALTDTLNAYNSHRLRVAWWTSETLADESAKDRDALLRLLAPLFLVLTSFTVACCFVGSWVRSRPWLGLGGVLSAGMAIVSSIGLLLLLDYHFTSVAYSMPFIMFSIGVDNVFILLSAWRKTPTNLGLQDRMRLTFSDAGVSITVTSLTDGLSFGVGCMATFPSVKVFCVYSTVAIAFVYLYQLTFFAGVMVLTGRRELEGRHCFTFRQVEPENVNVAKEKWHKQQQRVAATVAAGHFTQPSHVDVHFSKQNPAARSGAHLEDRSFVSNHWLARFFRSTYASLLLNPVVRVLVISLFTIYLVVAAWGCTKLELGLRPTDLVPANSYGERALTLQDQYFSDYGSQVHVVMTNLTRLDYRHPVWPYLDKEINLYEHTEFTGYADSWLRVFLAFVHTAGYDLTADNFVYLLKNIFLVQPAYEKFARDVIFDGSGMKIEAIRVPVQLRFVGVHNQSRAMHMLRRLAASSRLNVNVYSDFFLFAEQYDAVLPGTLFNIAIAGAAVICVSLLLIPKPPAALWVSLTIASINVGILGYMSLWNVRLDFVSMVTIVMSIGFCVDFSAHIAYHFSKERGKDAAERLRSALYAVGTPILQSAASTILGVSFLVLVDSYVYRSFLKTVILVVLLGAFHGLVILPVLLTILFCQRGSSGSQADYASDSNTNVTIGSLACQRTPPYGVRGSRGPPAPPPGPMLPGTTWMDHPMYGGTQAYAQRGYYPHSAPALCADDMPYVITAAGHPAAQR